MKSSKLLLALLFSALLMACAVKKDSTKQESSKSTMAVVKQESPEIVSPSPEVKMAEKKVVSKKEPVVIKKTVKKTVEPVKVVKKSYPTKVVAPVKAKTPAVKKPVKKATALKSPVQKPMKKVVKTEKKSSANVRPKTLNERIVLAKDKLSLSTQQVNSVRDEVKVANMKRKECRAKSDKAAQAACLKATGKDYYQKFIAILKKDQRQQFRTLAKEKKVFLP